MNKKKIVLLMAVCFIIGSSFGAFAVDQIVKITAYQNQAMKIFLNGDSLNAKDSANGNTLHPIVFNDRTYVPLRAIFEQLDYNVSWEGDTQSVKIDTKPEEKSYEHHKSTVSKILTDASGKVVGYSITTSPTSELQINLSEQTEIIGTVKEGSLIDIKYNLLMTFAPPAQGSAIRIEVLETK